LGGVRDTEKSRVFMEANRLKGGRVRTVALPRVYCVGQNINSHPEKGEGTPEGG